MPRAQTGRSIAKTRACAAEQYPHEQASPRPSSLRKPPFKLFYHEGDSVVDLSCKYQVLQRLIEQGSPDATIGRQEAISVPVGE
jgi:hypothetical protein